jgi:hypothetical protein
MVSMSLRGSLKTEHSGAKNGGGHWGTREEAKKISRSVRRRRGKAEVQRERRDLEV